MAGLKYTGVELHLLTEQEKDIYRLFECGIRGGICMAFNRHLKVENNILNNEYNGENQFG